jgi:hypothetical protein
LQLSLLYSGNLPIDDSSEELLALFDRFEVVFAEQLFQLGNEFGRLDEIPFVLPGSDPENDIKVLLRRGMQTQKYFP